MPNDQKSEGSGWVTALLVIGAVVAWNLYRNGTFDQILKKTSAPSAVQSPTRQLPTPLEQGYAEGYNKGKEWGTEAAKNSRLGIRLSSDPWSGHYDLRLDFVRLHGVDWVNGYEAGYAQGFHDYAGFGKGRMIAVHGKTPAPPLNLLVVDGTWRSAPFHDGCINSPRHAALV